MVKPAALLERILLSFRPFKGFNPEEVGKFLFVTVSKMALILPNVCLFLSPWERDYARYFHGLYSIS
jgi:hypothetical protein